MESEIASRQTWIRDLVLGTLLLALFLPPLLGRINAPGAVMDEGSLLVYPELILTGQLPYRDFETLYAPGNLYLLAGAYTAFGTTIYVERGVGLALRMLIIATTFAIARRWGTTVAVGSGIATGLMLIYSELGAYSWITGLAFALAGLWALMRPASTWRVFAGGLLVGAALLCRIDFTPALILAVLPFSLVMNWKRKGIFTLGAVLALLLLIPFALLVGPAKLADALFWYPVFRLNPARHLPLSTASPDLVRFLWLEVVAAILGLAAALFLFLRPETHGKARVLLSVSLFGALGLAYAFQRIGPLHVVFAALVPLGFTMVALCSILDATIPTAKLRPFHAPLAIVFGFSALALAIPEGVSYFSRVIPAAFLVRDVTRVSESVCEPGEPGFPLRRDGRTFFYSTSFAATTTGEVLDELKRVSQPGQRLFVGSCDLRRTNYNDTIFYHLMPQLIPATYFLEMNPRSANATGSRLPADVASADWLLLDRVMDAWSEPNASQEFGSEEANKIVHDNFYVWVECGAYLICANERMRGSLKTPSGLN